MTSNATHSRTYSVPCVFFSIPRSLSRAKKEAKSSSSHLKITLKGRCGSRWAFNRAIQWATTIAISDFIVFLFPPNWVTRVKMF